MHEDKLGWGWQNRVRSMLRTKKELLPNSVLEAPANLEAATLILVGELGPDVHLTDPPESPRNQELWRSAFLHVLACVVAPSLESRLGRSYKTLSELHLRKGLAMLKAIK